MTLNIERDKLYRLRNGEIVRVVCVDGHTERPIYGYGISCGAPYSWYSDGTYKAPGNSYDIIAEHKEPLEIWAKPTDALYGRGGPEWHGVSLEYFAANEIPDFKAGWRKFREVLE